MVKTQCLVLEERLLHDIEDCRSSEYHQLGCLSNMPIRERASVNKAWDPATFETD